MKVKVINGQHEGKVLNVADYDHFNYVTTDVDFAPVLIPKADCEVEKETKDVREFSSGAKRDSDATKPYTHSLKAYTRLRFGYRMTEGASKYGDGNWEKGISTKSYLESADRHWAMYLADDRSEDHLAGLIFNIQGIMLNEEKEGIKADHYFKKD